MPPQPFSRLLLDVKSVRMMRENFFLFCFGKPLHVSCEFNRPVDTQLCKVRDNHCFCTGGVLKRIGDDSEGFNPFRTAVPFWGRTTYN